MADKISEINDISPYNGRNNFNNNSNNQKKKESDNNFDQMLNDMINPSNLKPITKGLQIDNRPKIDFIEDNLSYPIKYASIPVYLTSTHQEDIDICGYIASKCFVVEEITKYLPNNEIEYTYKIVSPYNSIIDSFPQMNIPIIEGNKCINSFEIDEVFDNYKAARDSAVKKNGQLYLDDTKINSLNSFEEIVFQRTSELYVTKTNNKKRF